jgi:hypothetical protein
MCGLPASCAALVWSLSASIPEFRGEPMKINACPDRSLDAHRTQRGHVGLRSGNAAKVDGALGRRAWDIHAHH